MGFFCGTPEQLRRSTPERWARALERARLAQVRIHRTEDEGTYAVTSASRPGIEYWSDGTYCTCDAAGNGDPVCLHRAAVRAALSLMIDPQPEPPTPASPHAAERARCHAALNRHNEELERFGRVTYRTERAAAAAIALLDKIGYADREVA